MRRLLFVVLCHDLVNLCAVQLLHCAVLLKEKNLPSQGGLWQGLTEFTCVGLARFSIAFPEHQFEVKPVLRSGRISNLPPNTRVSIRPTKEYISSA